MNKKIILATMVCFISQNNLIANNQTQMESQSTPKKMIRAIKDSIASSKRAEFTTEQTIDAAVTAAQNVADNVSGQQTARALRDALQTVGDRAKQLKLSIEEAKKQLIQVIKDKMGKSK